MAMSDAPQGWTLREASLGEETKRHDLEFWQKVSSTARFAAAWELVKQAYALRGKRGIGELRLQRTVFSSRDA